MSAPPVELLFLLDSRDRREFDWMRGWLDDGHWRDGLPADVAGENVTWTVTRLADPPTLPDDASVRRWLVPVRIVWLPSARLGVGGLWQDLFHGRVIAPGPLRRLWIRRHRPERMRIVQGEGAWMSDLASALARRPAPLDASALAGFVRTRAMLTLERAERLARGPRYRIPRLIIGDLFGNARFARRLRQIAQDSGGSQDLVDARAIRYLHEMAASQTPFMLDLLTGLYRTAVRAHHPEGIDHDPGQLARLAERLRTGPVIFVTSHKSMLDTVAFSLLLFDADLPIPLTFGGINLRTFGVGWLARRAGIIFLRRNFQDNPVYKATFRRYIDYLIGKRFSLIWALEGTRSRTGKLLAPRFGMFRYVLDSLDDHRAASLLFVPVSVVYDQVTEVDDYVDEQRGLTKRPEGMTWAVRFLRRGTPKGRILIRIGEGVTVDEVRGGERTPHAATAAATAAGADPLVPGNEPATAAAGLVPALAFRIAEQMNAVTPVTPIAVICLVLLAAGDRAVTLRELGRHVRAARTVIHRRRIELVGDADFRDSRVLESHVGRLVATGVLRRHEDGLEPMVSIAEGRHHVAAYYRNTAIHHFLLDAVLEVCLMLAAAQPPAARLSFLQTRAGELRHLFRLEFYFPRRAVFLPAIAHLATRRFGRLPELLALPRPVLLDRLRRSRPLVAHGVLRSFADAYQVAVQAWQAAPEPPGAARRTAFVEHCLRSGRQSLRERRIFADESVSKVLYETAFDWALAESAQEDGAHRMNGAAVLLADLVGALEALQALSAGPAHEAPAPAQAAASAAAD